jgi:hypothetical protein
VQIRTQIVHQRMALMLCSHPERNVYRPGIFYVNVPIIAFFRHCGEFLRREKITRELTSVYKKMHVVYRNSPPS